MAPCAFPCVVNFFALVICKIHVFLCACLQVYLWGFPALVSVRFFPCSPFASFACFCWALKPLIYAPCVHPSTSRPSVSPGLLCRFCAFCMHGMTAIQVRNDHLCPSDPHSRDPACPYIVPFAFPPINAHLEHPLPSPTHYARHDMLLLVLADVVMHCILCLLACFVCLPACFGLFPVCTCPNPYPEPVRLCCCHCVDF